MRVFTSKERLRNVNIGDDQVEVKQALAVAVMGEEKEQHAQANVNAEVFEVSSPAVVEAPQRSTRRHPQSMKLAFRGAFRQDGAD